MGYTYDDCSDTIWDVQTTKIAGQDLRVSDVGGWDFDIHHRYNPQEGVLYKGDGSNVFLRERPRYGKCMDYVRDGKIQGQCAYKKTKERPCISPSLT